MHTLYVRYMAEYTCALPTISFIYAERLNRFDFFFARTALLSIFVAALVYADLYDNEISRKNLIHILSVQSNRMSSHRRMGCSSGSVYRCIGGIKTG